MSAPSSTSDLVVFLPLSWSSKSPVNRPCRAVPAEHLDVLRVVLVVLLDPGEEAVHEDRHGRDLDPAVRADLARLGHAGGGVAGEERGLVRLEGQFLDVVVGDVLLGRRVEEVDVDDGELLVRVGLGRGLGGRVEQEADRDDQVAVLADEVGDVRLVVGLALRLRDLLGHAQLVHRALHAVVGHLVERLVVHSTGIGDLTDRRIRARHCHCLLCRRPPTRTPRRPAGRKRRKLRKGFGNVWSRHTSLCSELTESKGPELTGF